MFPGLPVLAEGSIHHPDSRNHDDTLPRTRTEKIRQARIKQISHIRPFHLPWLNRLNLSLERVSRLEMIGLFPGISTIRSGSGPGPEVIFKRNDFLFNRLDIEARTAYTIHAYQEHAFALGEWSEENGPIMFFHVEYNRYTREPFFGIGMDSSISMERSFLMEQFRYGLTAGYRWHNILTLYSSLEHLAIDISPSQHGKIPPLSSTTHPDPLPGLEKQPDFLHLTFEVALDRRKFPDEPHHGFYVSIRWENFKDQDSPESFSFNRYTLDARAYLPLFSPARRLAFRFLTSLSDPERGQTIPFYLMETLGGKDFLRGFETFRFRDRHFLYLTSEYRWELFKYANAVFFYEAGKVFSDTHEFNLKRLQSSYGFGIRFKNHHRVFLSIELARSREDTRIVLRTGSEF